MNFPSLVSVTMTENDKRLLIILLIVILLFFIVLGLIGMGIRWLTKRFSSRVDYEMADCVKFGIVTDPKHYKELGDKKNNRIYFKQSSPAMLTALASLLIFIIYGAITSAWGENFWSNWGDLIYYPLFQEEDFVVFWGSKLLARWPEVWHIPEWHNEHIVAYILVTMWLISICYMIVATHAYIARLVMIRRRARTIYDKNMEDYNYYDHLNSGDMALGAKYRSNSPTQQSQNPQNNLQNPNDPTNWNR